MNILKKLTGWILIIVGTALFGGTLWESQKWIADSSASLVGGIVGVALLPACLIFVGWYLSIRKT